GVDLCHEFGSFNQAHAHESPEPLDAALVNEGLKEKHWRRSQTISSRCTGIERKLVQNRAVTGSGERVDADGRLVVAVVANMASLRTELIVPRRPIGTGCMRLRSDEIRRPSLTVHGSNTNDRVDAMVKLDAT